LRFITASGMEFMAFLITYTSLIFLHFCGGVYFVFYDTIRRVSSWRREYGKLVNGSFASCFAGGSKSIGYRTRVDRYRGCEYTGGKGGTGKYPNIYILCCRNLITSSTSRLVAPMIFDCSRELSNLCGGLEIPKLQPAVRKLDRQATNRGWGAYKSCRGVGSPRTATSSSAQPQTRIFAGAQCRRHQRVPFLVPSEVLLVILSFSLWSCSQGRLLISRELQECGCMLFRNVAHQITVNGGLR